MLHFVSLILMTFLLPSFALATEDYKSISLEAKNRIPEQIAMYREDAEFAKQITKDITNDTIKKPKSSILIFVSFSMPDQSLQAYLRDAKKINASIVIRGLVDNSFQKTFRRIAQLVKASGGDGVELNPLWFKRFDIRAVPAVVVVPNESNCFKNKICKGDKDYDVMTGNITLSAALREIRNRGHNTKNIADSALIKLQGNFYV